MEYYRLLLYITFGVLPSLIWLLYYLKKDLHPEPKKLILKVFLLGALSTIPVFFLQVMLSGWLDQLKFSGLLDGYPVIADIIKWFFVIALTEEMIKYLVVRWSVFGSKEMDEPLDIMLYMVVAALGFAAVENILYLFSPIDGLSFDIVLKTTITISFIRFIGATFLHTLCSGLLGYFLALSSLRLRKKTLLVLYGIFLAAGFHGLYNFAIMTFKSPMNVIVPLLVIMSLSAFMFYDFNEIKKVKSICKL